MPSQKRHRCTPEHTNPQLDQPGGNPATPAPVRMLLSEIDVATYVAWLTSPQRTRVAVLVATGNRKPSEQLNPAAIAAAVDADVAVIHTGRLTYLLAELLPPDTAVFGDAARIYPVGTLWHTQPRRSPVRFCQPGAQTSNVQEQVMADAVAAVTTSATGTATGGRTPATANSTAVATTAAPLAGTPAPVNPTSPASTGRIAPAGPVTITDPDSARDLAAHLLSPARTHPVLVVTTPSEDADPLLPAADLAARVQAVCDTVILPNGPASWAFAAALPPRTEVYGGAGRVYPIDHGWVTDPYQAPLRFCWPDTVPARVADTLEDDAYDAAAAAGLLNRGTPDTAAGPVVAAKVQGLATRHHALMRLPNLGQALMLSDAIRPHIEPNRLLRPGQVITGRVTTSGPIGRFDPEAITDDPMARALAAYPDAAVVLAKITAVTPRTAHAQIHPDITIPIATGIDEGASDGEAHATEDLDLLVAANDIVTVQLARTDNGFTGVLAATDQPTHASIPVIPGGPAWLTPNDLAPQLEPPAVVKPAPATPPPPDRAPAPVQLPSPTPTAPAETPQGTAPAASQQVEALQVAALQARNADLVASLRDAEQQVQRRTQEATRARKEARERAKEIKSLRDRLTHAQNKSTIAGSPADQFDRQLIENWASRLDLTARRTHPLAAYQLGPDFLDSLDRLQGIDPAKVIEVVVDVLTGTATFNSARAIHARRDGRNGQPMIRSDGAKAMRAALQQGTPSARRLHYWQLTDNTIELDQVGVHDDGL